MYHASNNIFHQGNVQFVSFMAKKIRHDSRFIRELCHKVTAKGIKLWLVNDGLCINSTLYNFRPIIVEYVLNYLINHCFIITIKAEARPLLQVRPVLSCLSSNSWVCAINTDPNQTCYTTKNRLSKILAKNGWNLVLTIMCRFALERTTDMRK